MVKIQTGNGHNTVFVCCISICRIWNIQYTKLKVTFFPSTTCLFVLIFPVVKAHRAILRRCSMPWRKIIHILPVIESMVPKSIIIHHTIHKRVTIIPLHQHNLTIGIQIWIYLSRLIFFISFLQWYFCYKKF